jgi:transcriptional regulator with XRE-family HTH domain
MSSTVKVFGNNFKYFMNLSGLSQVEVAQRLGVSATTVSDWYTGKKMPRSNSLKKISDLFGIKIADLMDDHEATSDSLYVSEEDKRLLAELRANLRLHQLLDIAKNLSPEYLTVVVRTASELDKIRSKEQ